MITVLLIAAKKELTQQPIASAGAIAAVIGAISALLTIGDTQAVTTPAESLSTMQYFRGVFTVFIMLGLAFLSVRLHGKLFHLSSVSKVTACLIVFFTVLFVAYLLERLLSPILERMFIGSGVVVEVILIWSLVAYGIAYAFDLGRLESEVETWSRVLTLPVMFVLASIIYSAL